MEKSTLGTERNIDDRDFAVEKSEVYRDAEISDEAENENDVDGEDVSDSAGGSGGKPRKRRKKKRYLLKFFILCLLIGGVVLFLLSDYFSIKEVVVVGNVKYKAEEIIKMGKIKTGENLFLLKKNKIIEGLLKDPYISSIKIEGKLPNKLKLTVVERREMAVIPYGAAFVVVDMDGYILRKTGEPPQLTQLVGLTIKSMNKGQIIEVKEKAVLRDTLDMLKAMEYGDLYFKKIDMTNIIIKAYIYDMLILKGKPKNVVANIKNGNIKMVTFDLYQKGITKGVINVGDDRYCSYSPDVQ